MGKKPFRSRLICEGRFGVYNCTVVNRVGNRASGIGGVHKSI